MPISNQPDTTEPPGERARPVPHSALSESEQLNWQQAALWHGIVSTDLRTAADALVEAVRNSPTSLEKGQAERALRETLKALATCDAGHATALALAGHETKALGYACEDSDQAERALSCMDCPSGELAGIHWPADPDGFDPPEGWSWVERCDSCQRYPDDESAATQLNDLGQGTEHRYFDRDKLEDRSADTEYPELEGCSVAINTSLPTDFPGPVAATPTDK